MKLLDLKVTLLCVKPPIWRKALVDPELTLGSFHAVLQILMGWETAHLHRFCTGECTYSGPQFGLEGGVHDERSVLVGDLLSTPGTHLRYEYDFGDGWDHEIRCEDLVESDVKSPYAVSTSGSRACPPEDCGRPPGYTELLRAFNGNRGRRNDELRTWAGGHFDPEAFSTEQTNVALASLLRGKNGKGNRRSTKSR